MKRKQFVMKLEKLNEHEYTKDKRLLFKNSDEVFKLFGAEDKGILNPFNDYTYEWLNSFLSDLIQFLEEIEDNTLEDFSDNMHEYIDSCVDVYTFDLTKWLNSNNSNLWYLEEAHKEHPEADNILMIAQYKAIEELYNNALEIVKKIAEDNNVKELV